MSETGGEKIFDPNKWKKLESAERRERMDPAKLAEGMNLSSVDVVLDIGCGTGFFGVEAAARCGKLIGVDISEQMLSVFREKLDKNGISNVELKIGKGEDIPVGDGECDVVFHVNLFHEIHDIKKFHAEIKRALKLGGRLFCVDWQKRETQGGPPLDHRIDVETAVESLQRDGFAVLKKHEMYEDQYVIEAVS